MPKNLLPQDIEGQAQNSVLYNPEKVSEIENVGRFNVTVNFNK
jgi:hypothetical protein